MARRPDGASQREWRERLKRYQRAGGTVTAFCRAEGVSTASFYAWRQRLEGPACSKRHAARVARGQEQGNRPLFVPVSMAAPAADVRIELADGTVVCVPAAAEEHLVRIWLRAALELSGEMEAERC
jgi:hypothetical protein